MTGYLTAMNFSLSPSGMVIPTGMPAYSITCFSITVSPPAQGAGLKNNVSIEGFSACAASHSTGAFEAIACRHAQRGFMPRAGGMMENNTHFANLLVGNGFRRESLVCFRCFGH